MLKTVKDSSCRLVHHRLSTARLFIRIVACPVLSLYSRVKDILVLSGEFPCADETVHYFIKAFTAVRILKARRQFVQPPADFVKFQILLQPIFALTF